DVAEYDLPQINFNIENEDLSELLCKELSIPVIAEDLEKIQTLNDAQK
ncbi:1635_t:CDS:1, partial [Racocetra persica]